MRTKISAGNPFGHNRHGFAWEHLPDKSARHLDFGCNDGGFLASLADRGMKRLVGADASKEAIERGRQSHPDLEFVHLARTVPLPFDDGKFTSITMLDVLEHVHEQAPLVSELRRVLTDDGALIITVPGRHFFSFLDLGNLKFRFPRLHRWYYLRSHSAEEYEQRYVGGPDGMIGDVSAAKRWHEHFTREKLARLLGACGFEVAEWDGSGFFRRLISLCTYPLRRFGAIRRLTDGLIRIDARWFGSSNLFCVARRKR